MIMKNSKWPYGLWNISRRFWNIVSGKMYFILYIYFRGKQIDLLEGNTKFEWMMVSHGSTHYVPNDGESWLYTLCPQWWWVMTLHITMMVSHGSTHYNDGEWWLYTLCPQWWWVMTLHITMMVSHGSTHYNDGESWLYTLCPRYIHNYIYILVCVSCWNLPKVNTLLIAQLFKGQHLLSLCIYASY